MTSELNKELQGELENTLENTLRLMKLKTKYNKIYGMQLKQYLELAVIKCVY